MCKLYPEYSHRLVGADTIKNYILGGKGVVTLKSPTGVHHTYAFRPPNHPENFDANTLFVYVLVGEHKWKYVGMVEGSKYRNTRHSTYTRNYSISKGAAYIVKMMYDQLLNTPMELYHEGCCSVCGKPLTNPASLAAGMGPRCRKMLDNG